MDSGYKVYAEFLRRRLESKLEKDDKLSVTQMVFRYGRGTTDAIYVVSKTAEIELRITGGKVYALFADMKAAFDEIKRTKIWRMLRKLGTSIKVRGRIEEIF